MQELIERLDGDHEFLRELLMMFREDVRLNLQRSRSALDARDLGSLSRTAHTMKGMLKNLAMGKAAETAGALEKCASENQIEPSRGLLEKLEEELAEILAEVEAQLAEVKL